MISDEILTLLQSKNRCLERLMEATRTFLAAPLENLILNEPPKAKADTTPLTIYEEERSSVIRTLGLHDKQINILISNLSGDEKSTPFMEAVRTDLLQNERLIHSVLNADDMVFTRIREAQGQITKLIQENRKSGELLSKFRSGAVATGEGMDKTL